MLFGKKIINSYLRLRISRKMLLGYFTLIMLIFLISGYALSSLMRLNDINRAIVNTDVPLIETTDAMIDNLITQELYVRRHAILKSPEILALFWDKSKEFDSMIEKISSLPDVKDISIERLFSLHSEYKNLFLKGIKYLGNPPSTFSIKYDEDIKAKQEELVSLIKSIAFKARQDQTEKSILASQIGVNTLKMTAMLCILGIVISLVSTVLITRSIAKPISLLKLATQEISQGKFNDIQGVRNKDELGDLSVAFNTMTKRLRKLEEMYLDANPLSRLPGNIAIENILKKRLDEGFYLAFCLIDLDDFKAFNDRYGYARGSEVIKATAKIIEEAVAESGTYDEFVGHIGGDDFVLVTTPHRFKPICDSIIQKFDKAISAFYDNEDLRKGFIMGKTRQGHEAKFPIMSVSIAVVTNLQRKLMSTIQVGELAAELKEYAKSLHGSVYVVDRRRLETPDESGENIIPFPKKASGRESDK